MNTCSFPFPSTFQGNLLQRNLRQTVSERQLLCTWILLQTPFCFRNTAHPALTLSPQEPLVTICSSSFFFCFKNNLDKAQCTTAVGRKWKADVEEQRASETERAFLSSPSAFHWELNKPAVLQGPQGEKQSQCEVESMLLQSPCSWCFSPLAQGGSRGHRGKHLS